MGRRSTWLANLVKDRTLEINTETPRCPEVVR